MLTAVKRMTVLTDATKQAIKSDPLLLGLIAKEFGYKNPVTIQRWIKNDHYGLTIPSVLDKIRDAQGLPQDAVLTEVREMPDQSAAA